MPRVSVFDGYTRTHADKAEGALEYYEVDEIVADEIAQGAVVEDLLTMLYPQE